MQCRESLAGFVASGGGSTMKVSELAQKTGLKTINDYKDREIESVYISDMVSDMVASAKPNSVVVTLQTHKSLIASANLVAAAMIVIVNGRKPSEDVVTLANRTGIGLFSYDQDAWAFAKKLVKLGVE
jgi:hypothetical protein